MFPPSLRFHAVSDDNNSTLCARDSTLDGDQVIFTVNLYDFQILYGNLFSAHVTCHTLALVDTGRGGAGTHRTRLAAYRTSTVSFSQCALIVTLDCAGIALTFAGAADIYAVAYCESVCLYDIAYVQSCAVSQTEFLQCLLGCDICLCRRFRLSSSG